jgi:hypothetical protein
MRRGRTSVRLLLSKRSALSSRFLDCLPKPAMPIAARTSVSSSIVGAGRAKRKLCGRLETGERRSAAAVVTSSARHCSFSDCYNPCPAQR